MTVLIDLYVNQIFRKKVGPNLTSFLFYESILQIPIFLYAKIPPPSPFSFSSQSRYQKGNDGVPHTDHHKDSSIRYDFSRKEGQAPVQGEDLDSPITPLFFVESIK